MGIQWMSPYYGGSDILLIKQVTNLLCLQMFGHLGKACLEIVAITTLWEYY